MLIAGLSSGFVMCFAPYIISLLFGEAFLQSSKLVLILALGPLGLACGCAHLIVQAATNGTFARDVTIAGGVVLFGAAFALIPRFGLEGAAAARSAVQIGVGVLTFTSLGKVLGHSAGMRQNLSYMLLVALAASLAVLLTAAPELQIWGLFVLFSVYCSFVCLICSRIWESGMLAELRMLSGGADA
jgi:O-antigen/teichoic acid export membrane protein